MRSLAALFLLLGTILAVDAEASHLTDVKEQHFQVHDGFNVRHLWRPHEKWARIGSLWPQTAENTIDSDGHANRTVTLFLVAAGHRSRRMVGGNLAPIIPWQVMVYLGDTVFDGGYAGGALISEQWVLTAARNLFVNKSRPPHYVSHESYKKHSMPKVYLGIKDRKRANSSNEAEVEKVVLHPDFRKTNDWDNDLALIKLKEPVTFSETVMPIPLPDRSQDLEEVEGMRGIVAGWGWNIHFTFSELLKFLVVSVANKEACKEEMSKRENSPNVDRKVFCTTSISHQENVCFGDSGGAFVVHDSAANKVYAVGILSFDKSCKGDGHAVFVKLSEYVPWINSVMRGDSEKYAELRKSIVHTLYSWQ